MRIPEALAPLVDQGVIEEVLRPLRAGKEAQVYLVSRRGRACVAKVYKEATDRSFQNRADYLEGRRVRNTRTARAIAKKSKFGREQLEGAWRSAEVDALYRLRAGGVRVPEPYDFVDGVLVMELVTDPEGRPAPRLCDVDLDPRRAHWLLRHLLGEIVRMLCAGLVHGDLSDFNVLLGADGPVIIDFPQASDAAHNAHARKLLVRDVDNVVSFLQRSAPELEKRPYGQQMWELYTRGQLLPDTEVDGRWRPGPAPAQSRARSLMEELDALAAKAKDRQETLGIAPRPARRPKPRPDAPPPAPSRRAEPEPRRAEARGGRDRPEPKRAEPPADPFDDLDALLDVGSGGWRG